MALRRTVTYFLSIFIVGSISAQVVNGKYDKLEKLYHKGRFESCLFKADNYTFKEKTSDDAEPYLYMAMCFLELSQSEDELIREDYRNGMRQAIRFTAKFVRKDKEDELYTDNLAFINLMKEEQNKVIKAEFDKKDYRGAASAAKLYNQLNLKEDPLLLYFEGANEMLSNNVTQGRRDMEKAIILINEQLDNGSLKTDKLVNSVIVDAFLKYSELLVTENQLKQAEDCLLLGLKVYPNNGYLKVQKNLIVKKTQDSP